MVDWQITATTVYCDAVDDDVTIIVNKDGSARCTGYRQYVEKLTKETASLLRKKSAKLGRELKCEGPSDHRITSYRDALVAEEKPSTPNKMTNDQKTSTK